MKRRKITKSFSTDKIELQNKKKLWCKDCGEPSTVSGDTAEFRCWRCVQKYCPVEERLLSTAKTAVSTRPKGWKFMKVFVDVDGTVYHSGEEQPSLKGTLPVTDVASIKASQKEKSIQRKKNKSERERKKQDKLAKEYAKKKQMKKQKEIQNKFLGE